MRMNGSILHYEFRLVLQSTTADDHYTQACGGEGRYMGTGFTQARPPPAVTMAMARYHGNHAAYLASLDWWCRRPGV